MGVSTHKLRRIYNNGESEIQPHLNDGGMHLTPVYITAMSSTAVQGVARWSLNRLPYFPCILVYDIVFRLPPVGSQWIF